MRPCRGCWIVLVCLSLLGCAAQTASLRKYPPSGLPAQFELSLVPFFPQTSYHCGPAALATSLSWLGIAVPADAWADQVVLPQRQGSLQVDMVAAARRQGAVPTGLPGTLAAVLMEVSAGHPVVVLQNLGLSWAPRWHYAVVVGYDLSAGQVVLRSGTHPRRVLSMSTFEHTWARSGYWAFASTRPGQWPRTAQQEAAVEAALGFERVAPAPAAQQVYASALQRWPGDLRLAMGLGNTRYASGDKAGAAAAFESAAKEHRSAAAWINLASTLLELNRVAQALAAAQEAAALADPHWSDQAAQVLRQALQAAGSTH